MQLALESMTCLKPCSLGKIIYCKNNSQWYDLKILQDLALRTYSLWKKRGGGGARNWQIQTEQLIDWLTFSKPSSPQVMISFLILVIHTLVSVVKSTPQNFLMPPGCSEDDVLDWNYIVITMSLLQYNSEKFVPRDTDFGIMKIINYTGYHPHTEKNQIGLHKLK